MTAPVEFGDSWLSSLPAGASVLRRDIHACTVAAVADDWFTARVPGETRRRAFDTVLVADDDRPLLAKGARFWWVVERVCLAGGRVETVSAIRLRRSGAETAETAFLRDRAGAGGAR